MARRCSVCVHPAVAEINRAIVSGTPIRDVAGRFGLSRSAIARHSADHMQEVLAAAAEARVIADIALGADLSAHIRDLQQAAVDVLNGARRRGDDVMVLAAVKTLAGLVEQVAELPPPRPTLSIEQRMARHEEATRRAAQFGAMFAAVGVDLKDPETRQRLITAAREKRGAVLAGPPRLSASTL